MRELSYGMHDLAIFDSLLGFTLANVSGIPLGYQFKRNARLSLIPGALCTLLLIRHTL